MVKENELHYVAIFHFHALKNAINPVLVMIVLIIANFLILLQYNCTVEGEPGAGGEYTVQSGFGWTNGVVLDFLNLYPNSEPLPGGGGGDSTSISKTSVVLLSTFLSLFMCALLVLIPCVVWCRWLYINGKRKYWARVRHEQDLHSSGGESHQSPSVFENPGAKEWATGGDDVEYHNVDL